MVANGRSGKQLVNGKRSLPLLALAVFGGSPAAYVAIYRFRQRHKVQKLSFVLPFWLIVTGQILALCGLPIWLGWI